MLASPKLLLSRDFYSLKCMYFFYLCRAFYIIPLPQPSCLYHANNFSEKPVCYETLHNAVHLREEERA